jgi:hypothetical protein
MSIDATRCGSPCTLCGLVPLSCSKEAIQASRPHRVPLQLHHLHITIAIDSVHHAGSCRSLLALSLADYALACLHNLDLAKIAPESRYQSAATSQAPSPVQLCHQSRCSISVAVMGPGASRSYSEGRHI